MACIRRNSAFRFSFMTFRRRHEFPPSRSFEGKNEVLCRDCT